MRKQKNITQTSKYGSKHKMILANFIRINPRVKKINFLSIFVPFSHQILIMVAF